MSTRRSASPPRPHRATPAKAGGGLGNLIALKALTALTVLAILAACGGEPPETASDESSPPQARVVLLPGNAQATVHTMNRAEGDAAAVAAGETLFAWYNCAGCHAPEGGGGMGPPLSDGEWIYGSDPASVFETIARGRPRGMPTWAGRIPEDHIWKLVAYVRSLGEPPAASKIPPERAPERDPSNDTTRTDLDP